jgi:hypothetical protein
VTDLQPAWDAAIAACLKGHADCSYGGMTPSGGYWLAAEGCTENHCERCAWCGAEAVTGFAGWGDDGSSIWGVPACQPCADRWVAEHPEWKRRDLDDAPVQSLAEALADAKAEKERMLAEMDPMVRELCLDADRRMENLLLWGNSDGPPPDAKPGKMFGGLMEALGLDGDENIGGTNTGLRRQDLDVAMAALFPEPPEQRVARILTDAGWTDAALAGGKSEPKWATDACPSDCPHTSVEHWHHYFCDAPYVAGPDGILEPPDFTGVAVKLVPRVPPIRKRSKK